MRRFKCLLICLFILSCHEDRDDNVTNTLASYIAHGNYEMGAVIACAASAENSSDLLTFFYDEEGATNIRFYETSSVEIDKLDFSKYEQQFLTSEPVFNGHLRKFTQSSSEEKWVIITFELNSEIKVSNPIRAKQLTKPTIWNAEVVVDQSASGMPNFTWEDNPVGDNAIYFQVVSDEMDNLLSGTYTYDNQFQYYDTSNVVLNVTTQTPPVLINGNSYNFTLMDVSLDNWVNWVALKTFSSQ